MFLAGSGGVKTVRRGFGEGVFDAVGRSVVGVVGAVGRTVVLEVARVAGDDELFPVVESGDVDVFAESLLGLSHFWNSGLE
jgi:hypothetical protein